MKSEVKPKKFYVWSNNGVTAVVTEEVWKKMQIRIELAESAGGWDKVNIPYPRPIFTFSSKPWHRGWVTGDMETMEELLHGHEVIRQSFYVPFSNDIQLAYKHSPELAEEEWKFRTDLREAMDAFGLVRATES